jgi:hypothetical protein
MLSMSYTTRLQMVLTVGLEGECELGVVMVGCGFNFSPSNGFIIFLLSVVLHTLPNI